MLTLIRCPFHPTPVLLQWHVKDPGHSAKSAGDRLHLKTHTPLTQRSRSGLTMPLCRGSVGTYPETSSHETCQLAEPLWTDSGLKSGICAREPMSTSTTTTKAQAGNEWSNILPKSSQARKKPPPSPPVNHISPQGERASKHQKRD